jgi:hypothetical protein
MKLIAYQLDARPMDIRPAPLEREWMEASNQRFAYRCLPLNIANGHGWELLCPSGFSAIWNGEPAIDAIQIQPEPNTIAPAVSHFGSAVLTFHVPFLFRTEPGFDLMVQGPINRPKDAIAPLSGIIETDWAPYTFTINWIFTQPEIEVVFEKDEPICHFFPIRRGEIESFEPEIRPVSSDRELELQYNAWKESRNSFNATLREKGSKAQADKWQKQYFRGVDSRDTPGAKDHRTRLRLTDFRR